MRLGLVKKGTGTLNLTGANNITTDRFAIENGAIRITGTYTAGFGTNGNQTATVGNVANQNGVLRIDGGTFNANKTSAPSMVIGGARNGTGDGAVIAVASRGFVNMTSGALNTASELHVGTGSGGILTSGSWLVVAANNDRAVLNQSGGTINVNANRMTIGAGGAAGFGAVNLTGGNFNVVAGANTGVFLGENGQGTLTLNGGNMTLNTNGGATSGTMQFAGNASSLNGHFNLNGGTLTAFGITKGSSTATGVYRFNFNGGTLRANGANAAFFADLALTNAVVNPGGAIIDSNGFNITVAEPLTAPTLNWVNTIPVATGGAGYLDTPTVILTGGTGTGATAVANVAGGVVTGFTITNRGSGYGAADVLTATIFGGGATTAATVGAITLAPVSTTGGFTKNGAGTLTMASTTNSYGGATTIGNGTLSIGGGIGNGGAASSLGASSNAAANLVLDGGTLQYTGATASTDRGFTISAGKTGIIDVTAAATALTLSGSTGALSATGNVTVNTGGTLLLSATGDQVNNAAAVTLNGGTILSTINDLDETMGVLTLSGNSTIDFGNFALGNTLRFADSSGVAWASAILSIWNWTPNVDALYVGTNTGGLLPSQLSKISFYSDAGTTPFNGFSGGAFNGSPFDGLNGEVSPVPEPSSVATMLGLLGLVGWRERRKARQTRAAERRAIG